MMNKIADSQCDREIVRTTLRGRKQVGDFDVFLCYNSEDRSEVKKIGELLKEKEVSPWLTA